MNIRQGAMHLFRLFNVDVYLHWTWFFALYFFVYADPPIANNVPLNVLLCVSLFALVLMHEFGHSLAAKSVGGSSDTIVMWPLGGVSYVDPPHRPGAMLWTIVAGPMVNAVLAPLFYGAAILVRREFAVTHFTAELHFFLNYLALLNVVLLIFNLLPIYPLDGGKIVWSLLWYRMGEWKSLRVACVIGLVGSAALLGYSLYAMTGPYGDPFLIFIAIFMLMQSWSSYQYAGAAIADRVGASPVRRPPIRAQTSVARATHADAACPVCAAHPAVGEFSPCGRCGRNFDLFANRGHCPHCQAQYEQVRCPACGHDSQIQAWFGPVEYQVTSHVAR